MSTKLKRESERGERETSNYRQQKVAVVTGPDGFLQLSATEKERRMMMRTQMINAIKVICSFRLFLPLLLGSVQCLFHFSKEKLRFLLLKIKPSRYLFKVVHQVNKSTIQAIWYTQDQTSVTRLGDLLNFQQLFKASGNK